MTWRRIGECQPDVCNSDCCRKFGFPAPAPNRLVQEWLHARGATIRSLDAGNVVAVIQAKCPQLDTLGRCKINDHKPQVCREFPVSPDQLVDHPRCTYSFVEEP